MFNRRDFMWATATGVGTMAAMSSETVTAAPEPTVSFNVIYPNHDGARFDADYYRSSHIPRVMKVMKATSVLLIEGVPMGTSPAPFAMIAPPHHYVVGLSRGRIKSKPVNKHGCRKRGRFVWGARPVPAHRDIEQAIHGMVEYPLRSRTQ